MKQCVVVLVCALGLAGCGPIVSGVQIVNADVALSAAKTAGAERNAVYEYVAAQEYLHKAREENAYSDFAAARVYADKALELAVRARKRAEALSSAEQPVVLPQDQPLTPAQVPPQ